MRGALVAGLGSTVCIGVLSVGLQPANLVLLASMGASAALCFAAPASPLASPRNTVLSHPLAALCSIGTTLLLPMAEHPHLSPACAVGAATMACILTKTLHPPAGGTALIGASTTLAPLEFLLSASVGAVVVTGLARAHGLLVARMAQK